MRRDRLRNFDRLCRSLLCEEDEGAALNIDSIQVKSDSDNVQTDVTAQVNGQQVKVATQQAEQPQCCDGLLQMRTELQDLLQNAVSAASAARKYQNYAGSNVGDVMYQRGVAQGQKYIIRKILKKLQQLGVNNG